MIKRNWSLIFILLITEITHGQNLKKVESYYDPFTRTRIHESYTTLTTPPYPIHGVYKEWDQSGVLMTEANFQNGKKHGAYKVFYNAGMRDLVGKENIGKLYTVSNYSNDKLNGLEQMYTYIKGKPQVILQKTWVNGDATKQEEWYDDGKPKSVSVINGLAINWYPNGQKEVETVIKNGVPDGKTTEWYQNGKVKYSSTLKNNCQVGEAIAYFEDGTVAKRMNFDPTTCKDMHTIQYFRSGKVKWEREGSNGHYVVNYYDSAKGFKSLSEEWIDNPRNVQGDLLKNGKTIKYFENGKAKAEQNFSYGQQDGDYKVFTSSGEQLWGGLYMKGTRVGKWKICFNTDWQETESQDSAAYYRLIDFTNLPWPMSDHFINGEKQFEGFVTKVNPEQFTGHCVWYQRNGQKEREIDFDDYGNPTSDLQYYESGKLKQQSKPTGRTIGRVRTYFVAEFYEDGKTKAEGVMAGDTKSGVWKYYDQNGKVSEVQESY